MSRLANALVIGLAMLGLAAGCNRGSSTETGAAPRIAFVMKTLNHPFFLDMQRGAQEAATREGIQLVVQAAEREIDVETQMQIIENLLQTGVKALIVTPSGSREIASAIVKANRAGVPVIVVDTRVDSKAGADNHLKNRSSDRTTTKAVAWPAITWRRRPAGRPVSPCSKAFPATRQETRGCEAFATPFSRIPG